MSGNVPSTSRPSIAYNFHARQPCETSGTPTASTSATASNTPPARRHLRRASITSSTSASSP